MPPPFLRLEQDHEITVLRLDRPPANAICRELADELDALIEGDALGAARALVITGTGDFFSGGLDLEVVPQYSQEEQQAFLRVLNRVLGWLYACPIPVVAAVNGHAIAGALILVLVTDYRVGPTDDALFGLTEARVGIPFPAVPGIVLGAELAPQDVRYSAFSARRYGPEEARSRGVLDELQPRAEVRARAVDVARDLASMPADGYRTIKHQIREAAITEIRDVVAAEADPVRGGWLGPEARDAARATLEAQRRSRPSG